MTAAFEDYTPTSVPDPSRGCCKVTVGNVCGSGCLVGKRDGKSLVLTNSHVAGTRIGRECNLLFPYGDAGNNRATGRIIMAGYSDKTLMDWAVLEVDRMINLPHTKLSIENPSKSMYTNGYPRCRGPEFNRLTLNQISHGGTLARWTPNSIGGQSGSAVHDSSSNLQVCLLTWSWGGLGAGQTTRGIWNQYIRRNASFIQEFGVPWPDDLEIPGDISPELENGIFYEANITSLPIWAHLDEPEPGPDPDPDKPCPELAALVRAKAVEMKNKAEELYELANQYGEPDGGSGGEPGDDNDQPTFGL